MVRHLQKSGVLVLLLLVSGLNFLTVMAENGRYTKQYKILKTTSN